MITQTEIVEIKNLFHLARMAVGDKRYDRLIWVSQQFHKTHPDIPETRAYRIADEETRIW